MLVRGDLDNANPFRSQPAPLCRLGTGPSDFLPSTGMRRPKPARKSVLGMFGLSRPLGLESKNLIQGDKLTTHSPIVWWGFLALTEAPVSSLSSQFFGIICRFLLFDNNSMCRLWGTCCGVSAQFMWLLRCTPYQHTSYCVPSPGLTRPGLEPTPSFISELGLGESSSVWVGLLNGGEIN